MYFQICRIQDNKYRKSILLPLAALMTHAPRKASLTIVCPNLDPCWLTSDVECFLNQVECPLGEFECSLHHLESSLGHL
jgi:hypothetical protein